MKYIYTTIFIISSFVLNAQDFYFNLQTGYGFATEAGQANYLDIELMDNIETQEIIAGGFGEGVYIRGSFGYRKSKFIGIELGLNYLFGRTITTVEEEQGFGPGGGLLTELTTSRNLNTLIFTPKLAFFIPSEGSVKPYVKTGLALGTFTNVNFTQNYQTDNSFIQTDIETVVIFKNGNPFGFTTTLGALAMVNENIAFTVDFNLLSMTYRPHIGTITKYEENGNDELENLTVREREIIFNNKIEIDNNTTPNDNEARRELPISLPMSNVTFNIGLQVNL